MNTCKTCKWWERFKPIPNDQNHEQTILMGDCSHPFVGGDYHNAEIPKGTDPSISFGGLLDEYFHTGQDFGCIHHTPKDNEP